MLLIFLYEDVRLLETVLTNVHLIGWVVDLLTISTMFLSSLSEVFILLNALFPAAISASVLYFGLFAALPSPIFLPHQPFVEVLVIGGGILLTCTGDFLDVVRDLRYPLWGEAPVLASLQLFRASWGPLPFSS